jgi:mRNA interferase HigB
MVVYGQRKVAQFAKKQNQARKPLARFLEVVEGVEWRHFLDVKESFPATDYVSGTKTYIFDIGGNKYRLTAKIDFEVQVFSIQAVMTHEEYDKNSL